MERLTGESLMARPADFVLWRSGREYFAAGRKVCRLSGGSAFEPPRLTVHDADLMRLLRGKRPGRRPAWLRRDPEETVALVAEANSLRLAVLEEEAVAFLREVREQHPDLPLVVSWSGGKDSAVASELARRAFPDERITHVFADTTIELPSTYDYLRTFRKANPAIPFLIGAPARDFFELCREIGPPSRIQRWCCTTHKAAPLADVLRAVGGQGQVLCVTGVRSSESVRRQGYGRVSNLAKIGPQIQVNVIAGWSDLDVWLWQVAHGGKTNSGYLFGLDRVGCAHCPANATWSEMVMGGLYADLSAFWTSFLTEVFERADVADPSNYVSSGRWKGRATGNVGASRLPGGHVYDIETLPCQDDDCATSYELAVPFDLERLMELLRPFGDVSADLRRPEAGYYDVVGPWGTFGLRAIPYWQRIRVVFDSPTTRRRLEGTLRLQFRKLQACVGCGGCAALCPQDAIIAVGEAYRIVPDRCNHCLECARGLRAGCRAADSLHVRKVFAHA